MSVSQHKIPRQLISPCLKTKVKKAGVKNQMIIVEHQTEPSVLPNFTYVH